MALTAAELQRLLVDTESDLVDRKEAMSDKDKICQAICAFANDLPDHRSAGVLFVGAADDGRPVGLAITSALLESLGAIRADGNILPPPSLTVRKARLSGAEMAVVECSRRTARQSPTGAGSGCGSDRGVPSLPGTKNAG